MLATAAPGGLLPLLGSVTSPDGWVLRGTGAFQGNVLTLTEDRRDLTRATHAFVVPAGTGTLQFQIRSAQFDAPGLNPPDAFEVSLLDAEATDELAELLQQARNVRLLIGGSCGEAIGSILQFAALHHIPFVTTPDGKGLVSPHHPLFRGVFGFAGHRTASALLGDEAVDLVLAVGTSMNEWTSSGWSDSLLNSKLVHIDESAEHLARSPMARLHVRGRLLSIFDRLVERKKEERAALDASMSTDEVIRDREELSEQLRALGELKEMAASYGFDSSAPAANATDIVAETLKVTVSERGATRMDDRTSDASMERRKKEGYF